MQLQMIDHIEFLLEPDKDSTEMTLKKEGVLSPDNTLNSNKINLMTGAAVSPLFDHLRESSLNIQEVYNSFEKLVNNGDSKAAYLLILLLYEALEMNLPYLFLPIFGDDKVLHRYIHEFYRDFTECINEVSD